MPVLKELHYNPEVECHTHYQHSQSSHSTLTILYDVQCDSGDACCHGCLHTDINRIPSCTLEHNTIHHHGYSKQTNRHTQMSWNEPINDTW